MKGFLRKARVQIDNAMQDHQTLGKDSSSGTDTSGFSLNYEPRNNHEPQCIHIKEPTALEIMRYRYHHGPNLGSVYVLERWLRPSLFPDDAEGSSELAAVKAWADRIGLEATKQKFEEFWTNAITEEDIVWLANTAKCTTIRLPIGYYNLPGSEFTQGTPFEPYAHVYSGSWHIIRELIARLRAHSIGVLVDLHALPGGANGQEHSGTNSGSADLWNSPFYRDLGVRCSRFLAEAAATGSEIAGIQLANEADYDSKGMYEWYDQNLAAIAAIDSNIPIIISDGWDLNRAVTYSLQRNTASASHIGNPIVIDTHIYFAFSEDDKQKSPQTIIAEVDSKLSELNGREGSVIDRGAVQVIVGEYSCVLTEDSWNKRGNASKEELVTNFGTAQSRQYQRRTSGSFFWTWKMDWMPGGEWGFVEQNDKGNVVPPAHASLNSQDRANRIQTAINELNQRKSEAVREHEGYWRGIDPTGQYEHEKYEFGWRVGYQDALVFLEGRATQGDRIGMLEMWVLKRIKESGYSGGFTWEFEQGLRKGVHDFYAAAQL